MSKDSIIKILIPLLFAIAVSGIMILIETDSDYYDDTLPTIEITGMEYIGEGEDDYVEVKVYLKNVSEITCECLPCLEIISDDYGEIYVDPENYYVDESILNYTAIPGGEESWGIYYIYKYEYDNYVKGQKCRVITDEYEANQYGEFFTDL